VVAGSWSRREAPNESHMDEKRQWPAWLSPSKPAHPQVMSGADVSRHNV
jgi:hypothetical protein